MGKLAKHARLDAVQAMMNSDKVHPWPEEMELHPERERCLQIYRKYQWNRPYDEWFEGDLMDLAQIAKVTVEIENATDRLIAEGTVVFGGKSGFTPIENPLIRVISSLSTIKTTAARRLNLASRYSADDEDRKAKDRKAKKEADARAARKEVEDQESLI